ncbi:MAG: EF-P lysine aminoacylase GenX [Desulfobacterales bacterium]|nr:EF-P lysine aminoacylase GenX [Desulfobacterales bacterium]
MTRSAKLNNLQKRSLVIQNTRDFFLSQGYLEVETPIRCPSVIPEAHIDPVMSQEQYLQASPELCMKRLLAMGAVKIFQICKCFRQGERGERHLPELTMLEWYTAHQTYENLMEQCQGLLRHIASNMGHPGKASYQGQTIDLNSPFERLTVAQAFDKFSQIPVEKALETQRFDEILSFDIEPNLGIDRPCFLYDYPASLASLAKAHPRNPELAQRFELYVAGIELANGFTELTDPVIQQERFEQENRIRNKDSRDTLPLPKKFLEDLVIMPDAAGIALGVDRLVMLFCDALTIDQVVAFTPETL